MAYKVITIAPNTFHWAKVPLEPWATANKWAAQYWGFSGYGNGDPAEYIRAMNYCADILADEYLLNDCDLRNWPAGASVYILNNGRSFKITVSNRTVYASGAVRATFSVDILNPATLALVRVHSFTQTFAALTSPYYSHGFLWLIEDEENEHMFLGHAIVSYTSSYDGTYSIACQNWSNSDVSSSNLYYYLHLGIPIPPTPPGPNVNPYADGDFSEPSGDPTGDYDDTSDVISVPSVPSFNLGITSLINVWVPSTTDINNLANYLWSNFDLTDPTKTLSKMFTDPLSYILSLHMLPFTVDSSTAITVTLAGLATTVSMPPATVQFKDIDCGSVTINEYWGNYLDYTYTKIVLCLPFCGQVDLDPDEVMGQTIKVKYRVDIITGAFVCFVYIDGDKVLGQYAGNCAAQIPISAADFSRLNAAVLGVAGAAASAFGSAALGGQGGMLNGASGGLISSIAANSQNAKVRAQHSGGLTGAPGFMGIQKPYLIIHRPRQSVPEDYEQFKGYPSNVTMQLSSCTGFTSVREIKLNGLPFTDGELTELKSILEGGVIL